MSPLRRIIVMTLLSSSLSVARGDDVLLFTAVYSVEQAGITLGSMTRSVRREAGGQYVYESHSEANGLLSLMLDDPIVERSVFTPVDLRPRPLSYVYEAGSNLKKRVTVEFDWNRHTITSEAKGTRWTMTAPAGTQDKLLYQYTLMLDLTRPGAALSYEVADGGAVKNYTFERLGSETMDSPFGRFETIKVRHQRADGRRRTTLWCAPALRFVPVRVDQDRDGTLRTARLRSLTFGAPP